MKTHSPVSTVSYMPSEYLKNTLDGSIICGDIDFYCFVLHKPEEEGLKEHIHLYFEPSHLIDTQDFMFKNDISGTINYRKSNFGDFYFYSTHNKEYLDDKGKIRKYTYNITDFITNDILDLNARVDSLDIETFLSEKYLNSRRIKAVVRNAIDNDIDFADICDIDYIPINQIHFAEKLYNTLLKRKRFLQYQNKRNEVK